MTTALAKAAPEADLGAVEQAVIADLKRAPSRPVEESHVQSLAESMRVVGLLAPIVLDPEGKVRAGEHRIQAALSLGWTTIPAIRKTLEGLRAELATLDENLVRHNGDALWRVEAYARRDELYRALHPEVGHGGARPGAGRKSSRHGGVLNSEPPAPAPTQETSPAPSFAADTAAKADVSVRSVQRHLGVARKIDPDVKEAIRGTQVAESITELEQLSRLPKEKQGEVAKRAVETGETVKRAVKQLRKEERIAEVRAYTPPAGEYAVIATDVPWPYDDELDGSDAARGGLPYPPMPIEEICALRVPAARDCVLWFWVTNTHVINGNAARVLAAWGFTPKTMYTWDKVLMANGRWGRGQTEHVIIAVRGHPVGVFEAERNLFSEKRSQKHSRKPEKFYKLVERSCPCAPGSRLEMFATQERKGWVTSGAELGAPAGAPDGPQPSADTLKAEVEAMGYKARVNWPYRKGHNGGQKPGTVGRVLSIERFRGEATNLGFASRVVERPTSSFVACRCGAKKCRTYFRALVTPQRTVRMLQLQPLRDHYQEHARGQVRKPRGSKKSGSKKKKGGRR